MRSRTPRLLSWLAFEADRRLDHEIDIRLLQAIGKGAPFFHREHQAEVRDGNFVPVDRVAGPARCGLGSEVSDDLVTVQVEVDPVISAPSFRATEKLAVEAARRFEIVHWERQVEGGKRHETPVLALFVAVQTFSRLQ